MPPLEEPVYFVDRSLGKRVIAERLRDEGIKVEVHDDHLAQDAPDEEWVRLAADRGWVARTPPPFVAGLSADGKLLNYSI